MRYIIALLILSSCNSSTETASPIIVENVDMDSVATATDSIINQFDSIGSIIDKKTNEIKKYQALKKGYEQQVQVYAYTPDKSNERELRARLNDANKEIARLNDELRDLKTKEIISQYYVANRKPDTVFMEPAVITPDDKSLVVTLNGKIPDNITIYLIPYSKRIKKLMVYEASCDQSIILKNDYKIAHEYNGVYFFNSVTPGKYLIKICTYYGNYKLVNKSEGKDVVKMEVAPPIQ